MSEIDPPGNPKVTFGLTPHLFGQAPIIPEVSAAPGDFDCDCGCMEIQREPAGDLTFYREEPKPAGVSAGYLILRRGGLDAEVTEAAMIHDGEGNWALDITGDSWRRVELKGEQ